jgi:phosphate-selective porin
MALKPVKIEPPPQPAPPPAQQQALTSPELQEPLRWALLDIDDDAFDQGFADPAAAITEAEQWAIGLNWTITPNLKAFTDYSITHFDGGAASGADRDDEKVLFTRLQLNY